MAEVVVQHGAQAQQSSSSAFGDIRGIFAWLFKYWWVIVLVLILVLGVIAIIYFLYLWGEEEKRKDPNFVFFQHTLEACELSKRKDWVRKKRRWWLMLFGLPTSIIFGLSYLYLLLGEHWLYFWIWVGVGWLVWLPIAMLAYKDLSMRVLNVDMHTVGYYRGHAKRQDGFMYLLLCVGRKWVILEDTLVVKIPENVLTFKHVKTEDAHGNVEYNRAWDHIDITSYVWNEAKNYIFIPMTTLVKEASYFYDPTLVEGGESIDLRQKIAESYHLMTQVSMAEQTYSHLGKVTNNAVDTNVSVVARKKEPEKQRDVNTGESPS